VLEFKYPEFAFDHELTVALFELDRELIHISAGTTSSVVYVQLAELFQFMTSVMSARIEGNRTTLRDAVYGAVSAAEGRKSNSDNLQEILNIQTAADFIDQLPEDFAITHGLVREIHKIVVHELKAEGDNTPGEYRKGEVSITGSEHRPPWPADVLDQMTKLCDFINEEVPYSQLFLKLAVAHHAFLWIHPFGNGNGRVARLLTYAVLVKQGLFSSPAYRIINPTAVFGADRDIYYERLQKADNLSNEGLVEWCIYVVKGILGDVRKQSQLTNSDFVTQRLFVPAIENARARGVITAAVSEVLLVAIRLNTFKAGDVAQILTGSAAVRSQKLRKLVDLGLILPVTPGARSYRLSLGPSPIMNSLIEQIGSLGLLPETFKTERTAN
jgi:Fic family protein